MLIRHTSRFVLPCCLLLGALAQPQSPPTIATPAEQRIAAARKAIAASPQDHQAHTALALALADRARETTGRAYYDQAQEAVRKSLELSPGGFEARKAQAWVLLGQQEFAKSLEIARELNKQVPDDIQVYGFLVDAYIALGRYPEAEKTAQLMLDLRANHVPAFTRAAHLRELFGDVEGALELMDRAYRRLPPAETEERAWTLTQIAHLHLMAGKPDRAEPFLSESLKLFPSYPHAVAAMAGVRAAQGKQEEAAELLRQRYEAAPRPESLYALGRALERNGRAAEAKRAYTEFEAQARARVELADNANHELVFYYADVARRPADALRVARHEAERRQDVHTLDAYAWALHRNGKSAEARREIERALAVGIKDADMLYRAGVIAQAANDQAAAEKYYRQSLDASAVSESAEAARKALARRKAVPAKAAGPPQPAAGRRAPQ